MNKIDLRDICGEDRLASALGVGTDAVGGLWKQLTRQSKDERQTRLDRLATDLHHELGEEMSEELLECLGRRYGISPLIVKPLADYHERRSEPPPRREWRAYFSDIHD